MYWFTWFTWCTGVLVYYLTQLLTMIMVNSFKYNTRIDMYTLFTSKKFPTDKRKWFKL